MSGRRRSWTERVRCLRTCRPLRRPPSSCRALAFNAHTHVCTRTVQHADSYTANFYITEFLKNNSEKRQVLKVIRQKGRIAAARGWFSRIRQVASKCTSYFPGSIRVHNPNGISIGSAIFAQLTAECRRVCPPPQNCPFPWDLDPI